MKIKFLFGFIIGVVMGAIAVLLTTPQSGGSIQEDVRSRIDAAMDEGRRAFELKQTELEARLASMKSG